MSKKSIKFAKFYLKQFNSKAYQSLKRTSIIIYQYSLFQQRWVKINKKYILESKELILPYNIFIKEPYRISRSSITSAIDELLEKGFIKIYHQGGKSKGDVTIYNFSNEWEKWSPGHVINKREPYYPKGFCVSKNK